MKYIPEHVIEQSLSYPQYRSLISELQAAGKTTGDNHSEAMLHYTNMNVTRMDRLDKTTKLIAEAEAAVAGIDRPVIWLTITEAWCGDAAQILPVLHKMAAASDQVGLRLILRDEYPEIMDAFLTNGGRSIPKVVLLDAESKAVLGSWGPRPEAVQQMVMDAKKDLEQIEDDSAKKERYQELVAQAQKWYARDKTRSIQEEFLAALEQSLSLESSTR